LEAKKQWLSSQFDTIRLSLIRFSAPETLHFLSISCAFLLTFCAELDLIIFTNKKNWFDPLERAKALPGGIQKQRGADQTRGLREKKRTLRWFS
jgi:hypothetical protein